MERVNYTDLKILLKTEIKFCVSIYMEASPIVGSNIENPVRLKNLLNRAKEMLEKSNLSGREVEYYFEDTKKIIFDEAFFRDDFVGLALFVTNEKIYVYKLPFETKDYISISRNCNITPLLEHLSDECFYTLVVDEGGCALYKIGQHYIEDISPKNIKTSQEKYFDYLEIEEEQFFHVEKNRGRDSSKEDIIFYGHGNQKDDRKTRATQYLKMVDNEVVELTKNDKKILVLAGHDHLVSSFKRVSHYQDIYDEFLRIEPSRTSVGEIRINS